MKKNYLYKKIYTVLCEDIKNGIYKDMKMLPSEKVLCERFDVERNTLRKALQLLADENIIEKIPGIGSKIVGNDTEITAKRNILYIIRVNNVSYDNLGLFHLRIFKELQNKMNSNNYNLIFQPLSADTNINHIIKTINPAAIILDSYMTDEFYLRILNYQIPCVSLNHYTPLITSVVGNNIDGAYSVIQKLIEKGHTKIVCIMGNRKYQSNTDRIIGVHKSRVENNIPESDIVFLEGNWMFESGYKLGEQVLNLHRDKNFTAVFSFNDDMAYGCFKYMEENNIRIPENISITGFDNADIYNNYNKKISTVDVNVNAIVDYACLYLFDSIEKKLIRKPAKIQVETRFVDNNT